MTVAFDNSYAKLPERFYERRAPWPVAQARLIRVNRPLAEALRIDPDWLAGPGGLAMLAGNEVPSGAEPIALAYAGHQFGHFVPQLGDGRAVLLGEVIDRHGRRRDVQLKGSGPTAFSRAGDGRAALGPVLREYVVSEAMATLGVPTTRALAAVATGEPVQREVPLPGAVLTRVAASHIRVGTFEYFAARRDVEALRALAEHTVARHYPEAAEAELPALALFAAVCDAQVSLVTQWMMVGFIHGVMNTDNTSISGETIDYGPCAFMDEFDPRTVFSSIDTQGRYAYGNQPRIVLWNMARFAETLLPLIDNDVDRAVEAVTPPLEGMAQNFQTAIAAGWCRKIGLPEASAADVALAFDLLQVMADQKADFTLTFRALGDELVHAGTARELFAEPAAFDAWAQRWRERLAASGADLSATRTAMHAVNPKYIPRNHQVEAVISAAVVRDDLQPFESLTEVLERPYEDQPGRDRFTLPPRADERVTQTFCGT